MKVTIDKERCIGCGFCADICPQVFRMNDEEVAEVYAQVTPALEEKVKEAADSCPVAAIEIEY